jgi:hypothetical protein
MSFYVRTALPPEQQMLAIPLAVSKLDPTLPVADLKTLEQQVRKASFLTG